MPRFRELDAIANLQPLWACHEAQLDELTLPFLDPEFAARHYPFGDLERAGTRFAAGSDWPVTSADPLEGIRIALTRVGPGSTSAPLGGPEQALRIATTFAAYTSGGAGVNGRSDRTGRVLPGYLADLALLDADPFAAAPESLDDTRVASTWVDATRVYEAG